MKEAAQKRFEWLVALNLEGISSKKEENELWQLVKSRLEFRKEFIEARHMHYLLTALLDDAASQKRFANRIVNALHPDRLNETAFAAAVIRRLKDKKPAKRERIYRMAVWKIAASILIVLGCGALFLQYLSQPNQRHGFPGREVAQYLDWNYQLAIPQLEKNMAAPYRHAGPPAGWTPQRPDPVTHRVKQMNAQITRMEQRWPISGDRLYDPKNGEPL